MTFGPDDSQIKAIWRHMVQLEQLTDGSWRASYPGMGWSVTALSEEQAEEEAAEEAIRRREDPNEVARQVASRRQPVELETDDPRTKGVWRFTPQAEQLDDGTWRAWYPSGGWTVTGSTEDEAKDKALRESIRRDRDPDEMARKLATMRRHLIEPVPGVEMFDRSVLESAWKSDNPAQAVGQILDQLGNAPHSD